MPPGAGKVVIYRTDLEGRESMIYTMEAMEKTAASRLPQAFEHGSPCKNRIEKTDEFR